MQCLPKLELCWVLSARVDPLHVVGLPIIPFSLKGEHPATRPFSICPFSIWLAYLSESDMSINLSCRQRFVNITAPKKVRLCLQCSILTAHKISSSSTQEDTVPKKVSYWLQCSILMAQKISSPSTQEDASLLLHDCWVRCRLSSLWLLVLLHPTLKSGFSERWSDLNPAYGRLLARVQGRLALPKAAESKLISFSDLLRIQSLESVTCFYLSTQHWLPRAGLILMIYQKSGC